MSVTEQRKPQSNLTFPAIPLEHVPMWECSYINVNEKELQPFCICHLAGKYIKISHIFHLNNRNWRKIKCEISVPCFKYFVFSYVFEGIYDYKEINVNKVYKFFFIPLLEYVLCWHQILSNKSHFFNPHLVSLCNLAIVGFYFRFIYIFPRLWR